MIFDIFMINQMKSICIVYLVMESEVRGNADSFMFGLLYLVSGVEDCVGGRVLDWGNGRQCK